MFPGGTPVKLTRRAVKMSLVSFIELRSILAVCLEEVNVVIVVRGEDLGAIVVVDGRGDVCRRRLVRGL